MVVRKSNKLSRTQQSWYNMRRRCKATTGHHVKHYQARGITVCERWMIYANFLADMGERPEGMTLERKNNNHGYTKRNCTWATPRQQSQNRRNVRLYTLTNRTMCLTDWARELGISRQAIHQRLERMPVEQALTMPKQF